MSIAYSLIFEESWRVGSGEGAAHFLDGQVRRDAHGLPFVPGSTIRGRVRESLRELAQYLGISLCDGSVERRDGKLGTLCGVYRDTQGFCPRCLLLGSSHQEPKVSWGAVRLASDRALTAHRPMDASTGPWTRARTRTAIDPRSGRADDEHLFSLEETRPDLELEGSLEIAPDLPKAHLALLIAALRHVREIGSGRRRGLGACRIRIDSVDLGDHFTTWQDAVHFLEDAEFVEALNTLEAPPAQQTSIEISTRPTADLAPSGPIVLGLTATVVGEISIGGQPESGNLVTGLNHIPGSTLRGAVAACWRGGYESEAFHECFVAGKIQFGFLYPWNGSNPQWPTPLSIRTCKLRPGLPTQGGHGLVDLLSQPGVESCKCGGRLIPWTTESVSKLLLSPHNRIDTETQTVPTGALFASEVLGDGTQLRGALGALDEASLRLLLRGLGFDSRKMETLLSGSDSIELSLRVGRRKATYGHVECNLRLHRSLDREIGLFPDAPRVPRGSGSPIDVRVDLLTPAIVRDEALRHRRSLLPGDLGLRRPDFDRGLARAQSLAGWQSAHRLPKASEVVICAGSTYLLRQVHTEELERLALAAQNGIGDRRSEGFGSISIQTIAVSQGLLDSIHNGSTP